MDKLKMHSINKVDENVEKIAKLFPNCLTEIIIGYDENNNPIIERAIDADVLAQEINTHVVSGKEERYQFTWPDKKKSVLLANSPIAATLRPCREESVEFDNTENLYIEGDNLDVLKLLRETYLNKVKMIYIDPPYNTGKDFIYEDDFKEEIDEFLRRDGQYDEQGNRLTSNFDSNGRFHTDWLNMIYPRLRVARDLLADDGIIFISIDDNEVSQLRKVCDEIYGSSNFVNCIAVKLSEPSGVKMAHTERRLPKLKEYILVYGKNGGYRFNDIRLDKDKWDDEYHTIMVGVTEEEMSFISSVVGNSDRTNSEVAKVGELLKKASYMSISEHFRTHSITANRDKDEFKKKNAWRIFQTVSMGSGTTDSINQARDKWAEQVFFPHITSGGQMYIIKGDYDVSKRKPRIQVLFAKDYLTYHPCDFWTDIKTTGLDNEGEITFKSGKKPLTLLRRLIDLVAVKDGEVFLDFFSGSGTLAEAVMQCNSADGKRRKFVLVQIAENFEKSLQSAMDANSKKAIQQTIDFLDSINKPHTICEIGKERIRRAGAKIKEENGLMAQNLDIGFRTLKLDSSNMKDVYYSPSEYEINILEQLTDNIKEDRSPEDLLFQVMLDLGILLSSKIEESEIAGKKVFNVADGFLIACFDKEITTETITAIAKQKPYYFVMRDSSLAKDSVAANFEQIFATYSPNTESRVL